MNRFSLFEPLYLHSALGESWSESRVAWAVDLLVQDRDTPNLRILAGLAPHAAESEVTEYFMSTLAELGVTAPSEHERRLGVVRVIAARIAQGDVDPVEGVDRIHRVAVGPLNHPAVLQPWCDLDGGFRVPPDTPKVEMLEGEDLERAIIAYSKEFLAGEPEEQLRLVETDLNPGAT